VGVKNVNPTQTENAMKNLFTTTTVRTLSVPCVDNANDGDIGLLVHAPGNKETIGLFCGRSWKDGTDWTGRSQAVAGTTYVVWEKGGKFDLVVAAIYVAKVEESAKARDAKTRGADQDSGDVITADERKAIFRAIDEFSKNVSPTYNQIHVSERREGTGFDELDIVISERTQKADVENGPNASDVPTALFRGTVQIDDEGDVEIVDADDEFYPGAPNSDEPDADIEDSPFSYIGGDEDPDDEDDDVDEDYDGQVEDLTDSMAKSTSEVENTSVPSFPRAPTADQIEAVAQATDDDEIDQKDIDEFRRVNALAWKGGILLPREKRSEYDAALAKLKARLGEDGMERLSDEYDMRREFSIESAHREQDPQY
jgi:hypothetical protein